MSSYLTPWRSIDPLHRSWSFQQGQLNGKRHKLLCGEHEEAPTAEMCYRHLQVSIYQQLHSFNIDDPELFIRYYTAGFLLGFGTFAAESTAQEIPF